MITPSASGMPMSDTSTAGFCSCRIFQAPSVQMMEFIKQGKLKLVAEPETSKYEVLFEQASDAILTVSTSCGASPPLHAW